MSVCNGEQRVDFVNCKRLGPNVRRVDRRVNFVHSELFVSDRLLDPEVLDVYVLRLS